MQQPTDISLAPPSFSSPATSMARLHNLKRQRADEASQDDRENVPQPTKKTKTRSELEIELDKWANWRYPPKFWDGLSEISLTLEALEELDRRNQTQHHHHPPPLTEKTATIERVPVRFARHGGPDLCDLRGYRQVTRKRPSSEMNSRPSSQSRTNEASIEPRAPLTKETTQTKKSTPYNRNFEMHLTDYQIYPTYSSQEPDLDDIRAALAKPRRSLSPSRFSEGAFRKFRQDNDRAKDEDDVIANVIPTILGTNQTHPCARNTIFGNLEALTDGTISAPKPDFYYGSYPGKVFKDVRDKLSRHIVPSTALEKPLAPNFFLEVKGPTGLPAVAKRQARYDGAVGSRGMHSLQNYGKAEPDHDGKPYTFSSIYQDGQLKLFTHHMTAPTTEGGRPEYHMVELDSYLMTRNLSTYIEGAKSFRNAVDMAGTYRQSFIQVAIARTQTQAPVTAEAASFDEADSIPDEFVDCEDYPTEDTAPQVSDTSAAPGYLHYQDNSLPLSQPLVADSNDPITTSFTSSFTGSSRSKRQISPQSSTGGTISSKSRKVRDTSTLGA